MREHLRSLIEQARQEAGSRTNGSTAEDEGTITDRLGTDAIRLARLAAAMHMAEAVQSESRTMKDRRGSEAALSRRQSTIDLFDRRHLHHPVAESREANADCRLATNERERER